MELRLEPAGEGVTVVTLPGDNLDAGNSQEFKNDIGPLLEKHRRVVFDMSELTFVDSSGCGALLSCLRKVQEAQGELLLCRVSRQVQDLFKVVRMDQVFRIFESREEAVEALTP
jgi:anti-sigma B factor antagonist